MKMTCDPTVDALTIRFVEERVECEVLRLNDQVAVDIGPGERIGVDLQHNAYCYSQYDRREHTQYYAKSS